MKIKKNGFRAGGKPAVIVDDWGEWVGESLRENQCKDNQSVDKKPKAAIDDWGEWVGESLRENQCGDDQSV